MKKACDNCGKEFNAKSSDLKRGWGRCCSKVCAASIREKSKQGYDPEKVKKNNELRENLSFLHSLSNILEGESVREENYDPGDSEYWDQKDFSYVEDNK